MDDNRFDNKLSGPSLAFKPLYRQVAEYIKQLIVERRWMPGEKLPNEFRLAEEFSVSQGTVRKALTQLTDAKIVIRRQGVGTFVSEHTAQNALFRFFPLQADGRGSVLPAADQLSLRCVAANAQVLAALQLSAQDTVVELVRRRIITDGEVCMLEYIYVPSKFFPGFEIRTDIPHTLYHFYQTNYHQTVAKTHDSIKAVIANPDVAAALAVAEGEPLLQVSRVTESIAGEKIEFRMSYCRSDKYHYRVELN